MPPLAKPVEILLVEDNPGDVRLLRELLREARAENHLSVAVDGVEALAFLRGDGRFARAPRPSLVLLDLNLPRKDGRAVLAEMKGDPALRRIPVVVMSTSAAEEEIARLYDLGANCYVTKPMDLDQFARVVAALEAFWLGVVELPGKPG